VQQIAAKHEEFWRECGGELAGDRMFDLPLVPPMRPLSEIKANKRAMYKQRYALLVEVGRRIIAAASLQYRAPVWDEAALREAEAPAGRRELGPRAVVRLTN